MQYHGLLKSRGRSLVLSVLYFYRYLESEGDPGCDLLKPASSVEHGSSSIVKVKSQSTCPCNYYNFYFLDNQKPSVDFMGHICPCTPPLQHTHTHLVCVNYGSSFSPQASPTSCALALPQKKNCRWCVCESRREKGGVALGVPQTD